MSGPKSPSWITVEVLVAATISVFWLLRAHNSLLSSFCSYSGEQQCRAHL